MHKVVAHKGCEQRGDEPRGVYLYAKIYTSAHPFLTSDGQVEFEAGADWEAPAYGYEILCFDCDESVMKFTDEVELYKLNYAFRNYPDEYNVEIIEVSD